MSDNQRHRRELANPRYFDVDSAIVIEIGDMVWLDTDDVKPASDFTWDTDLATTQRAFAKKFVGMSADRSRSADTDQVGVDKNGIKEFTCAAATFEIGDLVGPAKASGNALENQKVVAVASEDLAIGRVAKRYSSNTTTVEVEIKTFLDDMTLGTDADEIVDGLEALSGAARLSADAIKDGLTNVVFTAVDRTKLGLQPTKVFYAAYTCVADDDTANLVNIDTGFSTAPTGWIVQVYRAGVNVTADAIITNPGTGIIRIADGAATYDVTAGDIIMVYAWQV